MKHIGEWGEQIHEFLTPESDRDCHLP